MIELNGSQEDQDLSAVGATARQLLPSIKMTRLEFTARDGYSCLNPSIISTEDGLRAIVRTVRYSPKPVTTRNFWLSLNEDLTVLDQMEIVSSSSYPTRVRGDCLGFEDMRPFVWNNQIWAVGSTRELNSKGWWSETGIARLDFSNPRTVEFTDFSIVAFDGNPGLHEKNWMVHVESDDLRFIYSISPFTLINRYGTILLQRSMPIRPYVIRGGTQLLSFEKGWLCLVHEVFFRNGKRYYAHRIIAFSHDYSEFKFSRRFFFGKPGVEFAAGIAWAPNGKEILVSVGIEDRECWVATLQPNEVSDALVSLEEALGSNTPLVLSPAIGGSFWKIDPAARTFLDENTCSALRRQDQLDSAGKFIGLEGLKNPKNSAHSWNEFIVLFHITLICKHDARIMEIPSGRASSFIRSVRELGYRFITAVSDQFTRNEQYNGIEWRHMLETELTDDVKFDFIYCQNMLTSGGFYEDLLTTVSRNLRSNGVVFFSFEFWDQETPKSDGSGERERSKLLGKTDISKLLDEATKVHLYPIKPVNLSCEDNFLPDVHSPGTFANICLRLKTSNE